MSNEPGSEKIQLFTIGFSRKNAAEFFTMLRDAAIVTLIDVRLNNTSQLAGFTKRDDLGFFLKELCNITYVHRPEFAPTGDILDAYKKKAISWQQYEVMYNKLLRKRKISGKIAPAMLNMACLLCSEPTAEKCHRRLLAEYLREHYPYIRIHHL